MELALAHGVRGTRPVMACVHLVLSHLDEVCGQGSCSTSCKCVAVLLAAASLPHFSVGVGSPLSIVVCGEVLVEVDFWAWEASATFAHAALSRTDV